MRWCSPPTCAASWCGGSRHTSRATAPGRTSGTRSRPSRFERVTSSATAPRYRWVVLGVGSAATAALSAVQGGLPAVSPAIQDAFDLTLVQVTAVFTAFALGTVV